MMRTFSFDLLLPKNGLFEPLRSGLSGFFGIGARKGAGSQPQAPIFDAMPTPRAVLPPTEPRPCFCVIPLWGALFVTLREGTRRAAWRRCSAADCVFEFANSTVFSFKEKGAPSSKKILRLLPERCLDCVGGVVWESWGKVEGGVGVTQSPR